MAPIRILSITLFLGAALGAPAAGAEKTKKAPAAAGKAAAKAEGKNAAEGSSPAPSPGGNLAVPADLKPAARKALEEGLEAFRKVQTAEAGATILLKEAIGKLKSAATKAPRCAIPLFYLGQAYQMTRNLPEARNVLEKALKLNPSFHEARVELGDVRFWDRDLPKALEEYDRALAIEPKYPEALERKAIVLIRLGRFDEADSLAKEAFALGKNDNRKALVERLELQIRGPGWKEDFTHASANFEVSTGVSAAAAKEIAQHSELIRRAYNKVFDETEKPKRKFPIWLYPDAAAYHRAGNPQMAGGHYDTLFRKLVIFQYPKKEETLAVLYHEAFHQYLHDYLENAPQWFNEGLAEYFGAFQYVRKGSDEMMVSRPNPARLKPAKEAIERKLCPPAGDLMRMTQREMYDPRMAAVYYAQAWAMVYFIAESANGDYRKVLLEYYRACLKGKDLAEAYAATFGKIDMGKFDKEWKTFILNLK